MARISSLRAALLACLAVIAIGAHPAAAKGPADLPAVYLTDAARLAETRARVLAGDPALAPAVAALIELADEAAKLPMVSIADKPAVPPSGNRNDYVSLAPYWWPNPDTDDGLPYVRRDGRVNPERDLYDVNKLNNFGAAVRWSGFAYYFTGDERYAQEAVRRIRHFLIDPETAMTPRMLYGQFIPGVNNGREIGLIETLRLRWVPDAISLLEGSEAMTDEVMSGAKQWFADYAHWFKTSDFGIAELNATNNHGTWAEAQVAYYAAFAGDWDTVREMANRAPARLAMQIEPDGTQPHELKRTLALNYTEFNLRGYTELAVLAEEIDIDLWNYTTPDGRGLRVAFDFALPYIAQQKDWPYQQISPAQRKHDTFAQSLRRASIAYDDPRFEEAIASLDGLTGTGRVFLDLLIALPADRRSTVHQ